MRHFLMHIHVDEGSDLSCAFISLTEAQIKTVLLFRDSFETVKSDFRQTMAERGDEWANISSLLVTGATNPDYFEFDCGLIEDNTTDQLLEHGVLELTDKDLEIKRVRLEKSWEADDRAPKDFEDIAANMDCDEMLISEDGVYWASYEDYAYDSGSRVETVPILYSLLEKKD